MFSLIKRQHLSGHSTRGHYFYETDSPQGSLQNTASNGVAVGAYALTANTSGDYNTAVGYSALELNTTGENNVAIGFKALEANMLSAIFMIKELLPGMTKRNFGRIVNITSAMVKSPHPMMSLSTSARTGLTAFSKGISKDVAKHNVTINNLLPERFDTDRQVFMTEMLMKNQNISRDEARSQIASSIAANRFGKPEEFGATCAFLCSQQASFISGQNIQLDGGSYEGLI